MITFFHFRLGGGRREVLDNIDKKYLLREGVIHIIFKKKYEKRKTTFTLQRKHHKSKTIATYKGQLSMIGSFLISSIKYQILKRPRANIKYQGFKQRQTIHLVDSKARRKRIRV